MKTWFMLLIMGLLMVLTMIVVSISYSGTEICIDVPTTLVLPRVKAAYAWKYDYENNKKPGETLAAFTKRMVGKHQINKVVDEYEAWLYQNNYTTTPLREPNLEYDPNLPIDPNSNPQYLEIE